MGIDIIYKHACEVHLGGMSWHYGSVESILLGKSGYTTQLSNAPMSMMLACHRYVLLPGCPHRQQVGQQAYSRQAGNVHDRGVLICSRHTATHPTPSLPADPSPSVPLGAWPAALQPARQQLASGSCLLTAAFNPSDTVCILQAPHVHGKKLVQC